METAERVALVRARAVEVVTEPELDALFAREAHPRAYIGYEPSGRVHIGGLVTVLKLRDLIAADCEVTVLLADWHAWINEKLEGSLERIEAAGRYLEATFTALGVDPARVDYRFAHELVGRPDYWARVIRIAKATSVARTKRAMTVLGREEAEAKLDTAKLFYPAMQAADIFEMKVDLAYAGLDQRRAHILAREAAQHYGWPVPVAVHTPLVSSLAGGGRMDVVDGVERKMSKSDPSAAITVPCDPATIPKKIGAAFCPAKEVDGNPVLEIARWVVLPWEQKLAVERPEKFGGAVTFGSDAELVEAWTGGKLHPQDLKGAVAAALQRIVEPANRYFAEHPGALPPGL
ncbi:MAG TPA: tyrosine--tRNA ligase [Thermoplasmata archaeon]|nr:tyrosine--tRNA ligase [Thermoplasmata archaeon]